ncbi:SurA N-terminal domain-containing protein [Patescibacteria group bacterium]
MNKKLSKKNLRRIFLKLLYPFLIILIVFLFVFSYKFQGLIVIGSVDDNPIYSWQFARRLWTKFAPQAFNDLVEEIILAKEAARYQVDVSPSDLSQEIDRIQVQSGGYREFTNNLAQSGLSESDFKEVIKKQLLAKKIIAQEINITERELNVFISTYRTEFEASTEAELKKEAYPFLLEQRITEQLPNFWVSLKEKAIIKKYLDF